MSDFEETYARQRSALERAAKRLHALLREVVGRIEDKELVRAEFDDVRAKELPSLKRKAKREGWGPEEALTICNDLVGGRVVCNNVEDVYRFAELLKEVLPTVSGPIQRVDYIEKPTRQGYRALHLYIRLNVAETFGYELIPCEIQIRSRLQDTWAKLSHPDIYKHDGLPEDLRARARDLANNLATADATASDIRRRVQRLTEPPKDRPNLDRVLPEGIAYIFKDVFGRAPPEYVVAQAMNICEDLEIASLKDLPGILGRVEFREKLDKTYRKMMPVTLDPEMMLFASLYAIAKGDSRAVKYVRRQAQKQFDEADRFARREMLSSLPETVHDFIEELDDPRGESDFESWAEALGATDHCAICGATFVRPFTFAEAAVQHYDVPEGDEPEIFQQIQQAVYLSGVDTGGSGGSSMCSYHANLAVKDD